MEERGIEEEGECIGGCSPGGMMEADRNSPVPLEEGGRP